MGEKKSVGNYRQASVTSVPRENDGATNNGNPFQTQSARGWSVIAI